MSIAAIVLAAGASRRFGRAKQEVVLAGETLVARTVRIAREAGLSRVIVVTHRPFLLSQHGFRDDVEIVINGTADEGIAASIRCGVDAADQRHVQGAVILACDQPGLSAPHLRALIADASRLTASGYADSVGVPAYFPAEYFPALLQLRGDIGARSLLKGAQVIRADELELDIDTEQDLEAARTLFEDAARKL